MNWGDGISDNGGSPVTVKNKWLRVKWDFPAEIPCTGFEIAIFLGTDPSNTDNYIVPVQEALPGDRKLVVIINPNVNLTGVNSVVRAIYG